MKPNTKFITINDNIKKLKEFIEDIIIAPRQTLKKWSAITRQTPSIKLGYIGQHLASLITGVQGSGSGARGDDLLDGTEVKSCNKLDQLDKCRNCGNRVLRYEDCCPNPNCNSTDIERRNDSKWLFSIRDEKELNQYKNLDRILLILMDYPDFGNDNFNDIRISAYEIYPKESQCQVFNKLIDNHYYNIYRPKIDKRRKANPMNLHPFSYQFYKCNPTKVFEATIKNINIQKKCLVNLNYFVQPTQERKGSIEMPSSLLKKEEWELLNFELLKSKFNISYTKKTFTQLSHKEKCHLIPYIDEELRENLPLREIISVEQHTPYSRKNLKYF